MSTITDEMREEIVSAFLGSCSHDFAYYEDMYDLDYNEIRQILEDGEVFLCDCCGWWFEYAEMHQTSDDLMCKDCYEDALDNENGETK